MRQTRSFNLNDSNDTHKAIIERLDAEPSVSAVVAQALYRWYFETPSGKEEQAPTVQVDNTDVIEALETGFAMLASKLENIKQAPAPAHPRHDDAASPELDELRASVPAAVFLAESYGKKNKGIRLEDA